MHVKSAECLYFFYMPRVCLFGCFFVCVLGTKHNCEPFNAFLKCRLIECGRGDKPVLLPGGNLYWFVFRQLILVYSSSVSPSLE